MAELSARDANAKRTFFEKTLSEAKKQIRENFEEMDFENVDKRDAMEQCIETMEQACNQLLEQLSYMSFQ